MTFFSRQLSGRRSTVTRDRGFTMIELMVVIAIILVLIAMAAGRYERSVTRAKEAVLKEDLQTMRSAIEQFTLDKQQAPQSIDDLVSAGYLRQVPLDPMTRARDWHVNFEDMMLTPDQTAAGITDVHSSSDSVSTFENTPYSSW
jgi:general secretion pathway protein G